MKIIADQRKRFDDPNSGAPFAYAAALGGLRQSVITGDVLELRRMVFRAPKNMVAHYEQLAEGMQAFVEKHRPQYLRTNAASWQWGALPITVNQQIGMSIKASPRSSSSI